MFIQNIYQEIDMSMTLPLVVSGACAHQSARPSSLAATRFGQDVYVVYVVYVLGEFVGVYFDF